ncbi:hypothetical protein L5B97_11400 [Avibacterium sp. 20-15]|uniref:hypothetical protein n=1 Tax=unclassified Avibacterium TaxID=2685287 RepID=UPI002026113A|nr:MULTISPECIES: hypothetical protein [unclassified Avibacterium]MCW9734061.1 hypothetical protein [Avibacterium sp. 20-15]URL03708.1 hypothetical protein L4F93_09055 [Avibacterium sp. 20-132]
MMRSIYSLILILFFLTTDGNTIMDFKNIRENNKYTFNSDVVEICRSEYFTANLIKFIKINMDILSIPDEINKLNNEKNIIFRFYPPKVIKDPILTGVMDYYFIIESHTEERLGSYFTYHSWIHREKENEPWKEISIYGYYQEWDKYQDFGNFEKEDFESLGLTFKQKKLLRSLDETEWLKYSSTKYKQINTEVYNKITKKAYAIYEFETTKNNIRLKFSFTVSKEKYYANPKNQSLPFEWSQLFIERLDD